MGGDTDTRDLTARNPGDSIPPFQFLGPGLLGATIFGIPLAHIVASEKETSIFAR